MTWTKATKDEAQAARTSGRSVKFGSDGWMIDIIPPDLTEEAEKIFSPLMRGDDGSYVTNHQECECGEQYLVKSEHEETSKRHKQWRRRSGPEEEVVVPPQPLMGAFPKGIDTPRLEVGMTTICTRCHARNKKGQDYYPDPDSKEANRYPCGLCNGHGVRPNIGPSV